MNQGTAGRVWYAAGLVALLCPAAAMAQVTGTLTGTAQYEVNSNVFAQSKSTPLMPPSGLVYGQAGYDPDEAQLGDSIQRYIGGISAAYALGEQVLFASGQATTVHYDDFTAFNHSEYNGAAGLNWRMTGKIDGALQYTHSRSQAVAGDQTLNPDSINTSSTLLLGLNWQATGTWRVVSAVEARRVKTPQAGAPDYRSEEDIYRLAVFRNTGRKLTAGISSELGEGRYKNADFLVGGGVNTVAPYDFFSAGLTSTYSVGTATQFNSLIGYGRRRVRGTNGQLNALTGSLSFSQQLGGRTKFGLSANRAINSYTAGAASELDTIFGTTLSYSATAKSTFSASLSYGIVKLQDALFSDASDPNSTPGFFKRRDVTNGASLDYVLSARTWLQFRLYGNYQRRNSNYKNFLLLDSRGRPIDLYDYDGTTYGISVQMSYGSAAR